MSRPLPCTDRQALFFSFRGRDIAEAKALCVRCPQREACLELALALPYVFQDGTGVWGATTPAERRAIRRANRGPR